MPFFRALARGVDAKRAVTFLVAMFSFHCDAPRQPVDSGAEIADAGLRRSSAALSRPDTCTAATHDGHSYRFCSRALRSQRDAASKCAAFRAQLVRIDDPRENEFVRHNVHASS